MMHTPAVAKSLIKNLTFAISFRHPYVRLLFPTHTMTRYKVLTLSAYFATFRTFAFAIRRLAPLCSVTQRLTKHNNYTDIYIVL